MPYTLTHTVNILLKDGIILQIKCSKRKPHHCLPQELGCHQQLGQCGASSDKPGAAAEVAQGSAACPEAQLCLTHTPHPQGRTDTYEVPILS